MIPWVRRRRGAEQKSSTRKQQNKIRPTLEVLEDRLVPAVYLVANGNAAALDAAIVKANAHPGSTIDIGPGVYELTQTEVINANMTIVGVGKVPGAVVLDGSGIGSGDSVFQIDTPGAGTPRVVNFANLEITGGHASYGGGIAAGGNINLTLHSVIVEDNTASQRGGGIFQQGGTATFVASEITDNHAAYGGGYFNASNAGSLGKYAVETITEGSPSAIVSIINSAITANTAQFYGGGIDSERGTSLSLTGSTVDNNIVANGSGGGIAVGSGEIVLTKSHVDGNHATSDRTTDGGGIAIGGGLVSLVSSTVNNNTLVSTGEAYGGGIGFGRDFGAMPSAAQRIVVAQLTLVNSTVNGNTATASRSAFGGGIFLSGGSITLTESSVDGDSASGGSNDRIARLFRSSGSYGGFGGGIAIFGRSSSLHITKSTIANNSASTYGGGIIQIGEGSNPGTMILVQSAVTGNNANYGGGIYLDNGNSNSAGNISAPPLGATSFLVNDTVAGNSARAYGGGIFFGTSVGNVNMLNLTIARNQARDGGGMYNARNPGDTKPKALPAAQLNIGNSIIANNTAGSAPDVDGSFGFYQTFSPIGGFNAPNLITSTEGNNFTNPSQIVAQPQLGALQFNTCVYSPPTQTMRITAQSRAAFAANLSLDRFFTTMFGNLGINALVDQRGVSRVAGHAPSLGAFD